ncbi:hypothetical protein D9615_010542 [Tricholomella constricta]|uniref:Uncharacterized protein n=1 Tax=Tricholomella constricta TaxID=117010 RepID=A0A8H5GLF0_9AGAR|nr:hypothetical protein D9615_010542 [Tricholomella constricta]
MLTFVLGLSGRNFLHKDTSEEYRDYEFFVLDLKFVGVIYCARALKLIREQFHRPGYAHSFRGNWLEVRTSPSISGSDTHTHYRRLLAAGLKVNDRRAAERELRQGTILTGIKGTFVPGNLTEDVAKEQLDDAEKLTTKHD